MNYLIAISEQHTIYRDLLVAQNRLIGLAKVFTYNTEPPCPHKDNIGNCCKKSGHPPCTCPAESAAVDAMCRN